MRRLLIVLVLMAAGCSSTGLATGGPGPSGDSVASLPGSSTSRQPIPAPSDSDGLQASGPVAVSLLSRTGPLDPAGPYLGRDQAELLDRYRAALGGHPPGCLPAGCWSDARVPDASVLLAVRPAAVACYQLLRVQTSRPTADELQLDLQLNYTCRPGAGTAARMAGWLFALPASALPPSGPLTVTVRVSPRPGAGYDTVGRATL
ncbi:MAG: hypothetical protein ACJ74U_18405 [Jatrophihabitantaceae bacterium]